MVYLQYHMTLTPSLANPPEYDDPKGTPLHGPVTWNPDREKPNLSCIFVHIYDIAISANAMIDISTRIPLLIQEPDH